MYVGSLFIVLQDQRLACVHTQSSTGVDTSNMQGPSGISGSSCVNAIVIEPPPKSLESLLKDHAVKFVDDSSEYLLTVDRTTPEKLWIVVVTFYKGAEIRPNKLHIRVWSSIFLEKQERMQVHYAESFLRMP